MTINAVLCQEFADALREYSPQHEGVQSAEGAAEELEKVKADLEQRRREKEQQLKKEQQGWSDRVTVGF